MRKGGVGTQIFVAVVAALTLLTVLPPIPALVVAAIVGFLVSGGIEGVERIFRGGMRNSGYRSNNHYTSYRDRRYNQTCRSARDYEMQRYRRKGNNVYRGEIDPHRVHVDEDDIRMDDSSRFDG